MGPVQKPMTSENRLDTLFSCQKPDRVPIGSLWMSIGFNTVSTGGTVAEAYDDPDKSFHAFLKVADRFGWDQMFQCYRHTVLGAHDFGIKCFGFHKNLHAMTKAVEDHGWYV